MVGYHYCEGEIMAKNPKWTQPLESWKGYFIKWINTNNPQDILEAAIFFDFRCVYGNGSLAEALRNHINSIVSKKSTFCYHMAQSFIKIKPPVKKLGNLDIKMLTLPFITYIRLYAICEKLLVTNGMERLDELFALKLIDKTTYEELGHTCDLLMQMRLSSQVASISRNETPTNLVNVDALSRMEVSALKGLTASIGKLQTRVGFNFKAAD
jgi:signal-transduction protein with cAMP-binding, CBS, and nucleotidyltransferase domain